MNGNSSLEESVIEAAVAGQDDERRIGHGRGLSVDEAAESRSSSAAAGEPPMRVLTVRQPWAEAIIWGGKDVENRPRNIAGDYRGPVAIHSGLRQPKPDEWNQFAERFPEAMSAMALNVPWEQKEFGVILGVVELIDVHHTTKSTVPRRLGAPVCWDMITGVGALCSPWAESMADGWHLRLANARPLRDPIPFTGALGLRRLDAATTAAVLGVIA